MPHTPRLEPVPDTDLDPETAALVERLGGLHIFRTLAHHPELLRSWLGFGTHVLLGSRLDPRSRELVILRTGWRCGSDYEFGQHTLIATQAGITEEEVRRLTFAVGAEGWSDEERTLLVATDELIDDHVVGDETWERLTGFLDTPQVMDLVFTVGQYALVSMALNSFGVQREAGVPGFPS